MSAITITVDASTCPGGGHFDITASSPLGSHTWRTHKEELLEPVTKHELKQFAEILVRVLAQQLPGLSHAVMRNRVDGVVVSLSPKPEA